MLPLLQRPIMRTPILALPVPDMDLDFANTKALDRRISFTRAGSATYIDAAGALQTAGNDVPRFHHGADGRCRGLLLESAVTNYLLNSAAPATQTTGILATGTYCLWMVGTGSATITGATGVATGLGAASDGTPIVFVVTVAGTFLITVAGSPTRFQLENYPFPTSFITTTVATVARVVDICQINSTNFGNLWNTNEGTIIVDHSISARAPWCVPATLSQAALTFAINSNSNRIESVVSDSNGYQESISTGDTAGGTPAAAILPRRTAFAFSRQSLQISWCWDNLLVATRLARTFALTETLMRFGHSNFTNGGHQGTVARLRYYRKSLPLTVLTRIAQSRAQLA
jgi:hypothetical protein